MSEASAPTAVTTERLGHWYREMLRIRLFEDKVQELFLRNLVQGTTHLCQGQEAVSVGVSAALTPDDYVTMTYRGHGQALARGMDMEGIFAELMGKQTGVSRGLGGSMHLTDKDLNLIGCFAIVGAGLPVAVGAGMSAKLRGDGRVSVTFFGDGATNIGTFHEALNLAVVWRLPIVFVCENNQYMEYTPIRSVTAVEHPAADRASAYGLEPILVDGNDADVMYDTAVKAIGQARTGKGPSLVEALTYRHGGHSRADPARYRPEAEVREWLGRDPVQRYRERLLAAGIDEGALAPIDSEAQAKVDQATEEARQGPPAALEEIEAQVWADGGSTWRN